MSTSDVGPPASILVVRAWREPTGLRVRVVREGADGEATVAVFVDATAVAAFVLAWLHDLPPAGRPRGDGRECSR
jgi:hypothetical protein